jgi:hypothetical protein
MFRILKRRVDDAEILTAIECFIFLITSGVIFFVVKSLL